MIYSNYSLTFKAPHLLVEDKANHIRTPTLQTSSTCSEFALQFSNFVLKTWPCCSNDLLL